MRRIPGGFTPLGAGKQNCQIVINELRDKMIDKSLILRKLNGYKEYFKPDDDDDGFLLAICYIQLAEYSIALQFFEKSCLAMLNPPQLWKGTSQPNWLVDIGVLSGRKDQYQKITQELDAYKKDYRGNSLAALYSYGLMELLTSSENKIYSWIPELIKRPKIKDIYAIGISFQAILDKNINDFNNGLTELLKAHEGMAKHGALRETAEGFICMSAMSLAYIAKKRNFVLVRCILQKETSVFKTKFLY